MEERKKRLDIRIWFVIVYAASLILFGLLYGCLIEPPNKIFLGLKNIVLNPNPLITDFMDESIGGIGATFVNSGVITLILALLIYRLKVHFSGATYAAIFTVSGFAMFGKDLFNIWFIILGVFIYSKIQREKFSKYIYIALFGTAMSPISSEIAFNTNLPLIYSIPLGALMGIFIGLILPPISSHLLKMHYGYNLYNVGFSAGIIGTIIISILKSFGYEASSGNTWSTGNNTLFSIYLYVMFAIFLIVGFILNHKSFKGLFKIMKHSGRLVSDFIIIEGFGVTLINMAILGMLSTSYILIISGDLNGPTMGGILTIVGFGAFGKHPRNVIPIFIGIFLASLIKLWGIDDPAIQLAALFGTALAPIAGEYGILYGIIAAMIHSSVVQSVGYLHAGLNLYNNGFSAGIVATVLVPIIEAFRKDEKD